MSMPDEAVSEAESFAPEAGETRVPDRYKVAVGILLLSLIVISLLWFQQASLLQLQNNQLSSHSSSLSGSLSDLTKIVNLQKSQVLAANNTLFWTAGVTEVPLNWSCQCFQYSGYLRIYWASGRSLSLRIVQFDLNFTTPSTAIADFKIPISGSENFNASFVMTSCPAQDGCTATYSAIYHY